MNLKLFIIPFYFLVLSCGRNQDNSKPTKVEIISVTEDSSPVNTQIYIQTILDSLDERAEILLYNNKKFQFSDMRDESCWFWSEISGTWVLSHDTLVLSPNREVNTNFKLHDRIFIVKGDSLLFINPQEKNRYINWGNFQRKKSDSFDGM